jgi:hypothetical protein
MSCDDAEPRLVATALFGSLAATTMKAVAKREGVEQQHVDIAVANSAAAATEVTFIYDFDVVVGVPSTRLCLCY